MTKRLVAFGIHKRVTTFITLLLILPQGSYALDDFNKRDTQRSSSYSIQQAETDKSQESDSEGLTRGVQGKVVPQTAMVKSLLAKEPAEKALAGKDTGVLMSPKEAANSGRSNQIRGLEKKGFDVDGSPKFTLKNRNYSELHDSVKSQVKSILSRTDTIEAKSAFIKIASFEKSGRKKDDVKLSIDFAAVKAGKEVLNSVSAIKGLESQSVNIAAAKAYSHPVVVTAGSLAPSEKSELEANAPTTTSAETRQASLTPLVPPAGSGNAVNNAPAENKSQLTAPAVDSAKSESSSQILVKNSQVESNFLPAINLKDQYQFAQPLSQKTFPGLTKQQSAAVREVAGKDILGVRSDGKGGVYVATPLGSLSLAQQGKSGDSPQVVAVKGIMSNKSLPQKTKDAVSDSYVMDNGKGTVVEVHVGFEKTADKKSGVTAKVDGVSASQPWIAKNDYSRLSPDKKNQIMNGEKESVLTSLRPTGSAPQRTAPSSAIQKVSYTKSPSETRLVSRESTAKEPLNAGGLNPKSAASVAAISLKDQVQTAGALDKGTLPGLTSQQSAALGKVTGGEVYGVRPDGKGGAYVTTTLGGLSLNPQGKLSDSPQVLAVRGIMESNSVSQQTKNEVSDSYRLDFGKGTVVEVHVGFEKGPDKKTPVVATVDGVSASQPYVAKNELSRLTPEQKAQVENGGKGAVMAALSQEQQGTQAGGAAAASPTVKLLASPSVGEVNQLTLNHNILTPGGALKTSAQDGPAGILIQTNADATVPVSNQKMTPDIRAAVKQQFENGRTPQNSAQIDRTVNLLDHPDQGVIVINVPKNMVSGKTEVTTVDASPAMMQPQTKEAVTQFLENRIAKNGDAASAGDTKLLNQIKSGDAKAAVSYVTESQYASNGAPVLVVSNVYNKENGWNQASPGAVAMKMPNPLMTPSSDGSLIAVNKAVLNPAVLMPTGQIRPELKGMVVVELTANRQSVVYKGPIAGLSPPLQAYFSACIKPEQSQMLQNSGAGAAIYANINLTPYAPTRNSPDYSKVFQQPLSAGSSLSSNRQQQSYIWMKDTHVFATPYDLAGKLPGLELAGR